MYLILNDFTIPAPPPPRVCRFFVLKEPFRLILTSTFLRYNALQNSPAFEVFVEVLNRSIESQAPQENSGPEIKLILIPKK